jgi:hypothetical protein
VISTRANLLALLRITCFAVILFASQAFPAYAYLDPVTASFLFQGLIGGVVAVLAGVRSFRRRVFSFFVRKKPKETKEPAKGEEG